MNNKENDKAIKNFFKFLKQVKGSFFLFGHIPEEGLGFCSGRKLADEESDAVFDWACGLQNDQAFNLFRNFLQQTIASLMEHEEYEKIAEIKDIAVSGHNFIQEYIPKGDN